MPADVLIKVASRKRRNCMNRARKWHAVSLRSISAAPGHLNKPSWMVVSRPWVQTRIPGQPVRALDGMIRTEHDHERKPDLIHAIQG